MGNLEHRDDHGHQGLDLEYIDPRLSPHWKRAHRDWRFWVGALFISVAIVMTWHCCDRQAIVDLSRILPRAKLSRRGWEFRLAMATHSSPR